MPFAVIETGGKQYLISPKDKIRIEKLPAEEGKEVIFDRVLLVSDNETKIGQPYVEGAKVSGKVLKVGRGKKLKILKYKAKTRYRKRLGHRQHFTEVEIQSV